MRTMNQGILCAVLAFSLAGCAAGPEDAAEAMPDEGSAVADAGSSAAAAPAEPERVQIPSGTTLIVELGERLSAADNTTGETFSASIAEDVVVDGRTVIAAGATAAGRILEATESGRVQGVAEIALQITDVSVGGQMIPISTQTFEARAETTRTEDATRIGAGAGIGAAVGGILGGGDGAALGAAIGGGGGTAVVLATRGDDIELPSGTRVNFVLGEPVMLP